MSTNPDPERASAAAACLHAIDGAFFRALSEPARVDLVRALILSGRSDVGTIAKGTPRDRSVTTRHLQVLEAAGILRSDREGRHTYYEIDGARVLAQLEQLVVLFRTVVPACCPPPSTEGS
jgi:DNA-binding transcriptional ArsR family regulator